MSVRNFKPWELDVGDLKQFQEVLPKDEPVQLMLEGWGSLANKSYLATCLHSIHPEFTGDAHLKKTLQRSKKRNRALFGNNDSCNGQLQ